VFPAVIVVPVISQAVILHRLALIAESSSTSILLAVTAQLLISFAVIVFDAISLAVISQEAILLATIVLAAIFAQVVNELWSAHPNALNVTFFQSLGNAAHIIILFSHTASYE
jgi:hypothetical protein